MEQKNLKKIVYIGPVGSGKSTQADLLAEKLGIPHIQMGELLRASTDPEIQKVVASGSLVPDVFTMKLLADELSNPKYDAGFIIDGVPRTIYQAQNLPFEPDIVIYLAVRDSENVKRLLLRKRVDDTEEVIKKRLEIYHDETTPVLDFYRAKNKLLEINGEPPIEIIFEDVRKKLGVS